MAFFDMVRPAALPDCTVSSGFWARP